MQILKCLMMVLLLISFPALAKSKKRSYVLPAKAQILFDEIATDTEPALECADFKVTAEQVRQFFRDYKPITTKEQHDYYLWSPCTIKGKIIHKGKRYFWQARAGNTLTTDYPTGKTKTLGGPRTDHPSGR